MDTIEVKLPVSGKVATIRNYTTRADDDTYDGILLAGVNGFKSEDGKTEVKFSALNAIQADASYVLRLVQSIDGDSKNIPSQLGALRSKDYAVIKDAVAEVVEAQSPKAVAANQSTAANSSER